MAWRAPHVYELYSNGNELGSGMFVRGDSVMNSERSYKWISSISYSGKVFSVHADGYLQWISGYIYDEPQKMRTLLSFQGHILYSNTGRPRLSSAEWILTFTSCLQIHGITI